mmetsp:Transcript_12342/g.16193  ORF Transcript_12342/g.16193 Transcript_12342/m.16193 type:complete len:397 (+) Transcript_12342:146-1336(+)|eukprot:CAMPEP_0117758428 /NCGR_PEP_ID=MMETSP0947-20121206/15374_1 /TAXON_ID=44440 /ORGANISM="Chattonella subsalsa, Strain CCMP2191" /LENGTH=396 /DNA_ID=CAMNT_0005578617 /DNA_START=146 /DNA_END=1336 /DNA_ORIENTATION=-
MASTGEILNQKSGEGDLKQVESILEAGADVNFQDDEGWAPLHNAAIFGCIEIAKHLLKVGALPSIQNHYGWTPLHSASCEGFTDFVVELINAGADMDLKTQDGCTALHYSCWYGHIEIVKILLDNGADPTIKNDKGFLPDDVFKETVLDEVILEIRNLVGVKHATVLRNLPIKTCWSPIRVSRKQGLIQNNDLQSDLKFYAEQLSSAEEELAWLSQLLNHREEEIEELAQHLEKERSAQDKYAKRIKQLEETLQKNGIPIPDSNAENITRKSDTKEVSKKPKIIFRPSARRESRTSSMFLSIPSTRDSSRSSSFIQERQKPGNPEGFCSKNGGMSPTSSAKTKEIMLLRSELKRLKGEYVINALQEEFRRKSLQDAAAVLDRLYDVSEKVDFNRTI